MTEIIAVRCDQTASVYTTGIQTPHKLCHRMTFARQAAKQLFYAVLIGRQTQPEF